MPHVRFDPLSRTTGLLRLGVCAMALSGAVANVTAATFTDDFSTGLDPAHWSISRTTPALYAVDATSGAVHLAKLPVASPGGFQAVNVNLQLPSVGGNVTGDFELEVSFVDAVLGAVTFDQVQLNASFANGRYLGVVYDNSGGGNNRNFHLFSAGTGIVPQGIGATSATKESPGTLRIKRTGARLVGSFNSSAEFVASVTETSAVTAIWLSLQNNGTNDAISVSFDNFRLAGPSVVLPLPPPPPAPVPLPAGILMLAPGLLVALGMRRSRSQTG